MITWCIACGRDRDDRPGWEQTADGPLCPACVAYDGADVYEQQRRETPAERAR